MIRFFEDIWSLKIPPKIKCFVWRLFRDRLPSGDNLTKEISLIMVKYIVPILQGGRRIIVSHFILVQTCTRNMAYLLQVVWVAKRVSWHY